ncbi:MAG TPA: sigma-70 family RNA polymerase sigma factor [Kofleriaceae bacterium]|nr:sigma-70 family RNA polymerase sigma factor [Kofleriaceae bacterium]
MDPYLLAAIERNRRRLWAICYRMTGAVQDADDLCQEAIARAIERADQVVAGDPTGWLLRIATTTSLDHLRRATVRDRVTTLVDPLDLPDMAPGERAEDPERAAILREDVRYAVVVALQALTPRQRAALVLHDVCDRPIAEVAAILELNPNAAKALLHRARVALAEARHRDDVDTPVDPDVVEALARAVEAGSLEQISALLAEEAWGVVDGGGVIPVLAGPSLGREAVMRRFVNAWRRLDNLSLTAEVRRLNGEPGVIVRVASAPQIVVAIIHVESRARHIAGLRIDRDPRRTAAFAAG